MDPLYWIIGSSLLMSAIAMVGSITLLLKPSTLQRILLPLVPEVNKYKDIKTNLVNYVVFITGILLMLSIKVLPGS